MSLGPVREKPVRLRRTRPARQQLDWLEALDRLTPARLATTGPFPWPGDPRHTVAHMVAWVNAELMKNVAEIGQLRLQRAVGQVPDRASDPAAARTA